MRKEFYIFALLFIFFSILFYETRSEIKFQKKGHLVAGKLSVVTLKGARYSPYSNTIEIDTEGNRYCHTFKGEGKVNAYRLDLADMDGDGIDEIVLGVYKKAPHHRVMAKRVFLYNFTTQLLPKYRCSRLYLPMEDYVIVKKFPRAIVRAILKDQGNQRLEDFEYGDFKYHKTMTHSISEYEALKIKENQVYGKRNEQWIPIF